jgi:transposase
MVRRWVESYRKRGANGLRKKFNHYSADFKLSAFRYTWSEGLK